MFFRGTKKNVFQRHKEKCCFERLESKHFVLWKWTEENICFENSKNLVFRDVKQNGCFVERKKMFKLGEWKKNVWTKERKKSLFSKKRENVLGAGKRNVCSGRDRIFFQKRKMFTSLFSGQRKNNAMKNWRKKRKQFNLLLFSYRNANIGPR